MGLPLRVTSLGLPLQSLGQGPQGVGGGGERREHVNPDTFQFCVLLDKAAPQEQGRVSGEALQSKERGTNRQPQILQGPEGIWMENQ